jgi:ABC-type transport system involved in multi-copper enzyme maturation permease subunit
MKAYLRDFWRQIRVLGVVFALVGLCTISVFFGATDQPTPTISSFVYYYEQGIHFLFFVGGETGQPIPGITVSVLLQAESTSHPTTGPVYPYSATTGSDGVALVSSSLPSANYSVAWFANSSVGSLSGSWEIEPGPTGIVEAGAGALGLARVGFFTTQGGLFVFFAQPGGTPAAGYSVCYGVVSSSLLIEDEGNPSCQNMTVLGTIGGYSHTFPLSFAGNLEANSSLLLVAEIVAPNGSVVASTSPPGGIGGFPLSDFPATAGPTAQASHLVSFIAVVMTTYICFVAVLFSFYRYGRDRVTRTLESVLWRPVTPLGLLLERYASAVVPLVLMIGLSILGLDVGLVSFWKVTLPTNFALTVIGAMIATASTFVGIAFLASRLLRSVGALIGATVALLVLFVVLWTPVLSSLVGSTAPAGGFALDGAFLNPALLPALAIDAFTGGSFPIGIFASIPAPIVVPVTSLIVVGLVWVLVPLLASLLLARSRD